MKNKLITIGAFALGVAFCAVLLYGTYSKADTTISPGMGWILDSSSVASVVTVTPNRSQGGSIVNKGSATVYINWSGGAVTATTAEGVNKCYLETGDSVRVPKSCTSWSHATAASTAKLIYVEE